MNRNELIGNELNKVVFFDTKKWLFVVLNRVLKGFENVAMGIRITDERMYDNE